MGFRAERFGAKTLLTFLADGHFVREAELALEVEKAKTAPLQEIEGYLMGNGVSHLWDVPERSDIPERVREEIKVAGITYFMRKHNYLYDTDPWNSVRALEREFKNKD